ncbi:transcription factor TFIIIC subunit TFC3 KNAG_0C06010 [Huiozyma naganishii CBS 8797]|uniref:Uncharacterized protein n=1 Tax=Huiozyma naganishii (strain ATCC MYA-139 / BCRC 22969 / CBS 8797 / KCTC 17520 / NBRC 10181 / NCYC 3082 / Yp74L-3) TaxID=1071383 RepID=J7RJK6_HUIN7|nr:hypothetical protein KNAG_0C06010 [Kazachstania naganishii CBS 8797]CCK69698.1 hypothetical protein KNAG_0C06010 [Kazachstania naganishii CBS 8797]
MTSFYPDETVSKVCTQLAYSRGQLGLDELWGLLGVEPAESVRAFLLQCCVASEGIELVDPHGEIVEQTGQADGGSKFSLRLTEDMLWTVLTGYNKRESNVPNSAFELLKAVAASREKGINTMEMSEITGQDSRSITGRLKKLDALISGSTLLYKGHVVKRFVLRQFASAGVEPEGGTKYVTIKDHLGTIVQVVKNSKNGIRQTSDLKRELKFDADRRLSKAFISAVSLLAEGGYLKKIFVISPKNPEIKVRCVQYVRDYDQATASGPDNDEYSSSSDDDHAVQEDEDAYEGLDTKNATSLLRDKDLILQDTEAVEGTPRNDTMFMNRFYPAQHQVYELARRSGQDGITTIDATRYVCGKDFQRSFSKSAEYYLEPVGKQKLASSGFNLVKIYDFEGKKKFFRVFTEDNFQKFSGQQVDAEIGTLKPLTVQKNPLDKLNAQHFVHLNNSVRFGTDSAGNEVFFWNGDPIANELNFNRLKRKHPKKRAAGVEPRAASPQAKKKKSQESPSADVPTDATALQETQPVPATTPTAAPSTVSQITIGGFSGNSLRSLKRQRAILDILKKSGGLTFVREQFFEDVSKHMGSTTILDKKTVKNDIELMVKSNMLLLRVDPIARKRFIFLPELSEEAIQNELRRDKDSKKTEFSDVVQKTDVYFFDQQAENRFNGESKAARRIKNFQSKNQPVTKNKVAREAAKLERAVRGKKKLEEKAARAMETVEKLAKKPGKIKMEAGSSIGQTLDSYGNSQPIKNESDEEEGMVFHLNKKTGIQALIKAVVITKSIKKETNWDAISKIFPKNSVENIKKQWTTRRVRMGHIGWKARVEKWRKILVSGIQNGVVTLENVEQLDLPVLLRFWINHEMVKENKPISLYKNYNENKKRHTLIKNHQTNSQMGLAMSSMIQRETNLLKQAYTYPLHSLLKIEQERLDLENKVRTTIRSVLLDKADTGRDEVDILKDVSKEDLDKVFMDMAKEKQIYLKGSKLASTDVVKQFFETKGDFRPFEEAAIYCERFEELVKLGNGVIVNEEIKDIAAWNLIDMIKRQKVDLNVIPMERKNYRFNYTSRRFEISALTPPLIFTAKDRNEEFFSTPVSVPVPLNKPFSRLWIDSQGALRESIWKNLCCFIINETLFQPGITVEKLLETCYHFLSPKEIEDICDWLTSRQMLYELPFGGYAVTYKWYKVLA